MQSVTGDGEREDGRRPVRARRVVTLAVVAIGLVVLVLGLAGPVGAADTGGVSRQDGIDRLRDTRQSVDRTLALIKAGHAKQALEVAEHGYLSQFELVEVPLRIADNTLTIDTESKFAEIRQLIRDDAKIGRIRDQIIALRGMLDDAERTLTSAGVGAPMLIAGQSFLILFREGFEVVLLLSVLLGYLEAAKSPRLMKPILGGVALAAAATVLTVFLMPVLFSVLPFSREVLEALTALLAVAVLFYVSFWLIARLEHKRWMEFVRARLWSAISIGSTASLVAVGFTAVYREGFETALFYQSLISFGSGLGTAILAGVLLAIVALIGVAYVVFKLGRRLPVRTFMNVAVVFVMATSVALIGNAFYTLQAADVITFSRTSGPNLPIFLAEATGIWPTMPSLVAQIVLVSVYVLGALYAFVLKPRLARAPRGRVANAPA
jgi:high-affinity iron transporter